MPANASSAAGERRMMTEPRREVRVHVAQLVTATGGMLVTIGLGSCVAIALYDSQVPVAGLAHILLPSESLSRDRTNPAKFPNTAIPLLMKEMCERGARPERIHAKIVGGASMFANLIPNGGINIGERNIAAVRASLAAVSVPIVAEDTGSDYGRSVYFYVEDGRVEVRSLRKGSRVL
jgi:chemotaxis protein CheD